MFRVCLSLVALAGCLQPDPAEEPSPPSYVLVHGAWMGAWVWSEVAAELEVDGAEVLVVEMPAHGADPGSPGDATLEGYVAAVTTAIDEAAQPVVLVGHSMGGVVVTQAAEERSDRVSKLVYLAALVPRDGQSAQEAGDGDTRSHSGPLLEIDVEAGVVGLPESELQDIFCADCSTDAIADLVANYRDEPLAPLLSPVSASEDHWGRVERHYLYTDRDHAVSYDHQLAMTEGLSFASTTILYSDHSPFLSAPAALLDALREIAATE